MPGNLSELVDRIDFKVDSLESVLGTFIVSTNTALLRMERDTRELKREMNEFKREMSEFKDEMREFKDEMSEFKDESERDRKRMNKRWGELANKMGTIVEDIVAPNIPRIAKEYFGVEDIDFFAVRVRKRNSRTPSVRREFDAVAVSKTHFILNETKATPRINYIDMMIETLAEIDDWFPEYRGRILIPIFSSLSIPEEIAKYLTRNRIFGMEMDDDTMRIVNFEEMNRGLETTA